MKKKRILSGIRPTGQIHLGNYLGAVQNWVALQDRYRCMFPVVDYHAMTSPFQPRQLARNVEDMVIDLIAAGIDPDRSILFVQSDVPEHTELAWILGTITPLGWLERVPTFKEKQQDQPDHINLGLLGYPVLQAADILMYRAEVVPVGEDQIPHLELAREIVRRFNHLFQYDFPEPEALVNGDTARIMSLSNPEKKMSKSLGPDSYLALADSPEDIRRKIRRAVTDVGPRGDEMSSGVRNLFRLLEHFGSPTDVQDMRNRYEEGTLRYVDLKDRLAEAIVESFAPFRERRRSLEEDPAFIREVLAAGAEKAREIAKETMRSVREAVGIGRAFRESLR